MPSIAKFITSIQKATNGISVAELLVRYPDLKRRTAQFWLNKLVSEGRVRAQGEGRARRYISDNKKPLHEKAAERDIFPADIPLSTDSTDILAYINQPVAARKPVGYQTDFLASYIPNQTWYLPLVLRQQLHSMGNTAEINAPAGTFSRAILDRLLIDLSWASSHLEGNTYSRLDTVELIEHGNAAQGKAVLETQMILNHKSAIEMLAENANGIGFNRHTIMNLHSSLSENLLSNALDEGRIRQHPVEIGQSVFRPLQAPQKINDELDLLLEKVNQIADPFEQSFFVMVHLPYLQPFADLNKRTSRLAANLPLFRVNLCPLTFLGVSEQAYSRAILGVYELTRVELLRDLYVWAYERSTQEYLSIKRDLIEPDPMRLAYRDVIKKTIHDVVMHPDQDALNLIRQNVLQLVKNPAEQADVRALIIEELRRLHEGVLARYGLRPSELEVWKAKQISLRM